MFNLLANYYANLQNGICRFKLESPTSDNISDSADVLITRAFFSHEIVRAEIFWWM